MKPFWILLAPLKLIENFNPFIAQKRLRIDFANPTAFSLSMKYSIFAFQSRWNSKTLRELGQEYFVLINKYILQRDPGSGYTHEDSKILQEMTEYENISDSCW